MTRVSIEIPVSDTDDFNSIDTLLKHQLHKQGFENIDTNYDRSGVWITATRDSVLPLEKKIKIILELEVELEAE